MDETLKVSSTAVFSLCPDDDLIYAQYRQALVVHEGSGRQRW
jgi:hypothetical protein